MIIKCNKNSSLDLSLDLGWFFFFFFLIQARYFIYVEKRLFSFWYRVFLVKDLYFYLAIACLWFGFKLILLLFFQIGWLRYFDLIDLLESYLTKEEEKKFVGAKIVKYPFVIYVLFGLWESEIELSLWLVLGRALPLK